jgi:outer membrane protein OmpA-like peptidoglycan-associated protein
MKSNTRLTRLIIAISLMIFALPANAQLLKKLGKTAEKAAEKTVQRRVANETAKKTDQALDSILEPGSNGNKNEPQVGGDPNGGATGGGTGDGNQGNSGGKVASGEKTIQVYSKFDYVPGDKLIFYDDFGNDFIGDFPSKWNTNGSGEVVTLNDSAEKWFEIKPGRSTFYIPDVPALPEEYTVEFDLLVAGIDEKTSSSTVFRVIFTDDPQFKWGNNYAYVSLPLCQYHPVGMRVRSDKMGINNNITADIRAAVINRPHVSIGVNKQRFRLWVNEKKYIDIPRFFPESGIPNQLRFELPYMKDGKDRLFITNLKVAEGGVDLRRKLISEGKVSTNGILFDSGSANIQPQSMGIIRQISQVLQQEAAMDLNIVGHTDSDGDDASNMELSKRRAEAVKDALVNVYNIDASRLQTEGKGETEAVGDNNTVDGKAQNRRVEFIKI